MSNRVLLPSHQLKSAIVGCIHSQLPDITHEQPVLISGQLTYDTKACVSLGHLACQCRTVVWQFDGPEIIAIWCFGEVSFLHT